MRTQIEKCRLVMSIIINLEKTNNGVAPLPRIKQIARDKGIGSDFVDDFVRREKERGRLYSPIESGVSRAIK